MINITQTLRDHYPSGEFVLMIPAGKDGHRLQADIQARVVHIRRCLKEPLEMYAETEICRAISSKSDTVHRFLRVKIHTQPIK
jgi:hypothetical protein